MNVASGGVMRHMLIVALALGAGSAGADEVILRSGGRIVGEIRERRPDAVVVETGPGLVTVPAAQVARVVTTTASALSTYRSRAASLKSNDAEGWFELALWARNQGLNTQARRALDHVLAVHPNHAGAHQALGHVLQGGRWMTREEGYLARGFVPFEGSWITPAEREAILTERSALTEERRLRAEADARVREAEARALIAEAEAQRALAQAAAPEPEGIPYPWVLGGGGAPVIIGGAPAIVVDETAPPAVLAPPPPRPRPIVRDRGHQGRGNQADDQGRSNGRGNTRGFGAQNPR
jgi:hypothetical protein